jgi:hypothetical protein
MELFLTIFLIVTIILAWVLAFYIVVILYPKTIKFHSMMEFPEKIEGENVSKDVLLYKDGELEFNELGFYDFESNEWVTFSEYPNSFICWCYPPNASDFVKAKNKLNTKII